MRTCSHIKKQARIDLLHHAPSACLAEHFHATRHLVFPPTSQFYPAGPTYFSFKSQCFLPFTSSRLDITLSANFSGPAVTLTQTVEDRSLLWIDVYWASSSPHQSSALRFPPSPSTQAPLQSSYALLHSRLSMLSLTAQTMARSLSLKTS